MAAGVIVAWRDSLQDMAFEAGLKANLKRDAAASACAMLKTKRSMH